MNFLLMKATSFVFLTTTVDPKVLNEAYEMTVHGISKRKYTVHKKEHQLTQ